MIKPEIIAEAVECMSKINAMSRSELEERLKRPSVRFPEWILGDLIDARIRMTGSAGPQSNDAHEEMAIIIRLQEEESKICH